MSIGAPDDDATFRVPPEPEILTGRRAFSAAQAAFAGGAIGKAQQLAVGWYDTILNPELGSFALVNFTAQLDDLIGEIVRTSYAGRQVFTYVLQGAELPDDTQLAITRRSFLAIARLTLDVVKADVVAVQS